MTTSTCRPVTRALLATAAAVLVYVPAASAQAGLTVTPSLSKPDVMVGEPVRFWITIRNDGPDPVTDLRLIGVDAPGFTYEINPPCPCNTADCFATTRCASLRTRLEAHEQFASWGNLIATQPSQGQGVWLVLRWRDTMSRTQEVSVLLGRLTAVPQAWLWWQTVVGFLKDIAIPAIPLALGLLGLWFKRWERERADRHSEKEQRRTEIAETWREMLPLSHEYTIKHYMPVVAAAELAIRKSEQVRGIEPTDEDERKRVFFMCTIFRRRVRAQIEVLNGFYFKDRCGEELAAALLLRYDDLYVENRAGSLRRRNAILTLVEPTGPSSRYEAFIARWQAELDAGSPVGRDLTDEFQSFQEWMVTAGFATAMDVLGAFAAIVRLEMNRVYEPWYGKPEQMRMKSGPTKAVWEVAADAAGSGSVSKEELTTYLTGNGCAPPNPMPR